MNILEAFKQLRDDVKTWATNNFNALNTKIDEKTIPVDNKLDSTSTNPVQNKIVTKAINNIPKFSGDYNDLTNAPIIEDDSGNMVIADESGNIIFKADAEGIHTTAVSLNGETAASEKYVDEAIATKVDFTGYATEEQLDNLRKEIGEGIESDAEDWKIVDEAGNIIFRVDKDGAHTTSMTLDGKEVATKEYVEGIIPEVDLTGYATEEYVDDAVASIPTPDVSGQINAHNVNGESHADIRQAIEDAKEELSESIVAESNEWKIVDEAGNIIFSVDAEGAHTTELTLNGESAATESYVDEAIANIEFPTTDLTDYATKKYVDDAVGGKATHADLENLKEELSESIVSETDEFHIVDNAGNIVASIDENGVATTTVTARSVIVNGDSVEEHIDNASIHVTAAEKESWNNKSNFSGNYADLTNKPDLTAYYTKPEVDAAIDSIDIPETDLSNYYTKVETNTAIEEAKEELSESIVSKSDEWKVVDEAGNIIFSLDAEGAHTTSLTLDGEAALRESDLKDYTTTDDVNKAIAEFVEADPKALQALQELSQALEDHEDAYDALLETVGSKATKTELEELKTEISESIVSEATEFHIVDDDGNIIASINENGFETTRVVVDGVSVKEKDETLGTSAETIVGAINEIVNEKIGDISSALDAVIAQTEAIIGQKYYALEEEASEEGVEVINE